MLRGKVEDDATGSDFEYANDPSHKYPKSTSCHCPYTAVIIFPKQTYCSVGKWEKEALDTDGPVDASIVHQVLGHRSPLMRAQVHLRVLKYKEFVWLDGSCFVPWTVITWSFSRWFDDTYYIRYVKNDVDMSIIWVRWLVNNSGLGLLRLSSQYSISGQTRVTWGSVWGPRNKVV